MDAIIRRATLEDAEGLFQAHMRSIREVCSREYAEADIKAWTERSFDPVARANSIRNQWVWVVELNGKIEGFGHLAFSLQGKTKVTHVAGLYLTPSVLGKGLGRRILQFMIQESRQAGVEKILLEATLTAHGFYLSQGFKDSGPATIMKMGSARLACVPMEMSLL